LFGVSNIFEVQVHDRPLIKASILDQFLYMYTFTYLSWFMDTRLY